MVAGHIVRNIYAGNAFSFYSLFFKKRLLKVIFFNAKKNGILIFIVFFVSIPLFNSCNFKPQPEPLPLSVHANLNLLQENPQFVMYLNFKAMRRTEFWKKNISDTLLNAEKTFGSLLNTFKLATGASVSEGLDELYYSNSWFGENAIVLKGIFDKNKLNDYLSNDSIFSITKYKDGTKIYIKNDNGLYFFFKDDFTICASNYLKQIDVMMVTKDTSVAGLLLNQKVFDAIQNIIYKENLWMVSTEKIFIRGIFQNFVETTSDSKLSDSDSLNNSEPLLNDSTISDEKHPIENLYKSLSAVSFSAKMSNEIKFLIQGDCINDKSAKYLKSILNGVITVAKLSSAGNDKAASSKIFDRLKLERYDNSVFIELYVDDNNLQELRKTNLINEPRAY
jgi:hypothetical protein